MLPLGKLGRVMEWFWSFSLRVTEADSLDAVKVAFREGLTAAGYDCMAVGEIDIAAPRRSMMIYVDWPQEWFRFYQEQNLIDDDPLVRRLGDGGGAFAWGDLVLAEGRNRWALDATRSFGWVDGLVVPLRRAGQQRFGLVSLTRRDPVPHGPERDAAIVFACLGYERLRAMAAGRDLATTNANLSRREVQCLDLAATGLSDARIGARLGIATSTAHEHIERAKAKLGTRTRTEAVASAVSLGIVPL